MRWRFWDEMNEIDLRARIVGWGRSLFARAFTVGSSGNISVRCGDGFLVTPTNSCLDSFYADAISRLDAEWTLVSGDKPTKELPLHRTFYESRPRTEAVVHLHSTFATILSCLTDTDPADAIPPITPYMVMRVGRVPVFRYTHPGSFDVIPLLQAVLREHAAVLLANHGPVVAGPSLDGAVFAAEELEKMAKLAILTRGLQVRHFNAEQVRLLRTTFPTT